MEVDFLFRRVAGFTLLWLAVMNGVAQQREQAQQYVEQAEMIMSATRAMDDARDLLVMAANLDTTHLEANFKAGFFHLQTIGKQEAARYLLRVYRQKPDYRFDLAYWIGRSLHLGYQFEAAIAYYERYRQHLSQQSSYSGADKVSAADVQRRIEECRTAQELVANPSPFAITNVGSEINSEWDDYAPVVDAEESAMFFTTRRREGNSNDNVASDNKPFEDVFTAQRAAEQWGKARNAGSPISTRFNDSNLSLSADGKTLFLFKDTNEGDIFFSERKADGTWSTPQPMPRPINSDYAELSVCLSADGRSLYFSSNRPGGLGGIDLYVSTKGKKGQWSKPRNLGPAINTPDDEDGPFLDYDGKTLYFSSRAGKGMGGYDIFRSVWDEQKKTWSTPENMGYPINTPDDDVYLVGTQTPRRWYYSSVRPGGMGYTDIYLITEASDKPEEPETFVNSKKGRQLLLKVVDAVTGSPIQAKVDVRTRANRQHTVSMAEPGVYEWDLPDSAAHEYRIMAESKGHVFVNARLWVEAGVRDVVHILKMNPLIVGEAIILRNIYFETGSAVLTAESDDELDLLEEMMLMNPSLEIEISGHTDNVGDPAFNKDLSRRRAESVKNYIVKKGVETARVKTVGFGMERPLASNDDEEDGRALNRRVEFKVIKK